MKKILSVLLTITMIVSIVSFMAVSMPVRAETSGYYAYTVENGEATIVFVDLFNFTGGDVIIPSTLGGYPVTTIGEHLFDGRTSMTSVSVPDSVTSIGYGAFANCTNLTSVSIGSGVTNIDAYMFSGCTGLTSIIVDADNKNYYSDSDGILFNKDTTILVCYPAGKTNESYTIPDGITGMGEHAFADCSSLTKVTIPNSATSISDGAFYNCSNLTSVNIPNSVTSIGHYAFFNCGIKSITIPSRVTTIGSCAFDNCDNLSSVKIPNSVTDMGRSVFAYCKSLTSVSIGTGITELKSETFYHCENLASVQLSDNITTIEDKAFSYCSNLTNIIIPDKVTEIGEDAFSYCSNLARVCLPTDVEDIKKNAFFDCNNLTDVWYKGTSNDKKDITIGSYNSELINAEWHYNACENDAHIYSFECDTNCNKCGWVRITSVEHDYNNACDNTCNVCGDTRTTPDHRYSNACDKYCNVCDYNRIISNHTYDNCFENCEAGTYGSWQISTDETGIYKVNPSVTSSAGFSAHDIAVFDKNGCAVKYNETKQGWPLVKDQLYTVSFRYNYDSLSEIDWILKSVAYTTFRDTNAKEWYNDAITYSVGRGLISGYGGTNNFGPADNIQRQDFLVILARLDGVDLTAYGNQKSSFPDVPEGSYYEAAVNWGAKNGIVTGYQNGKFGVGDKITREQLVTFLYRYADYKGFDVSYTNSTKNTVSKTYTDYKKVSDWSQDCVLWAIEKGVIKGKTSTTIVPGGNALRCEVAQIMYNIFLNDTF